jgi:hypothetical protein
VLGVENVSEWKAAGTGSEHNSVQIAAFEIAPVEVAATGNESKSAGPMRFSLSSG